MKKDQPLLLILELIFGISFLLLILLFVYIITFPRNLLGTTLIQNPRLEQKSTATVFMDQNNQKIYKTTESVDSENILTEPTQQLGSSDKPVETLNDRFPGGAVIQQMEQEMLRLINEARMDNGLTTVEWDGFAAKVGEDHAIDMVNNGYFSHWNMKGFGPDIRYSFAGGYLNVMENIYTYYQRYDDGTPVLISNWQEVIRDAHIGLMNSPGHRKNILDPSHTHVGVGFSYNLQTGTFSLAQEFINQYVMLNELPSSAQPGETIIVSGSFMNSSQNPMVNLSYEPIPHPMSLEELNLTNTYQSAAQFVSAHSPIQVDQRTYKFEVKLGDHPGLYHILMWVDVLGAQVQTVDWIIQVD